MWLSTPKPSIVGSGWPYSPGMGPPDCADTSIQSEPSPRREVYMLRVVALEGKMLFQLTKELPSLPTGSRASAGSGKVVALKSSKEATPVPLEIGRASC